jgi:hypothetical protein
MDVTWSLTAFSTAELMMATVVRVLMPQAAALAPHQPQLGWLQPPYQPAFQGRQGQEAGQRQAEGPLTLAWGSHHSTPSQPSS